ncbi:MULTISPECIES: PspC domain-containing protein [unclassified Corynebacterium]|uniref:PspC domain-containing protein n=1 Tax=unclassified Corynebacterium TaxID=2624378 RepID=UPI002A9102ED|nr:PspC domain-containing protein [Corynebacterium sp.]MDY5786107.1 PspC domain-containing protein [Corynebacterium sp.]
MTSSNASFTNQPKKLTRSLTDRWIAGVCGGIAQRYNIDATLVRLGFVALSLTGFFPGIIAYIVAWVIMPEGV